MKKYLYLLGILLTTSVCKADCSAGGLSFYPETPTANQNSVFIIVGYGKSEAVVAELGKSYKVYLQSGKKNITLKMTEINTGMLDLTQALLVPEQTPEAGLEYTLVIERPDKQNEPVQKWNSKTFKNEPVKWKITKTVDNDAPTWTKKPEYKTASYTPYGCGPAEYVIFKCNVNDARECMVKVNMTSVKTKKTFSFYIGLTDSTISVGHGMCGGAFTFEDEKYEVGFDLMDFSGNTTAWTGDRIKFTYTKP